MDGLENDIFGTLKLFSGGTILNTSKVSQVDFNKIEQFLEKNNNISSDFIERKAIIQIGNESLDLNSIEHEILRKQFDDPRIHFAINCASFSCPVLRNEAFDPKVLNQQLESQARRFINNARQKTKIKGHLTSDKIAIAKMSWIRYIQNDIKEMCHSLGLLKTL